MCRVALVTVAAGAPLRLYIRPRRALQLAPRLEPSGPRLRRSRPAPRCVCEDRLHRFSFAVRAEEITHIELLSASCECRHWHYSTLRTPFIRGISASPPVDPLLDSAVPASTIPRGSARCVAAAGCVHGRVLPAVSLLILARVPRVQERDGVDVVHEVHKSFRLKPQR